MKNWINRFAGQGGAVMADRRPCRREMLDRINRISFALDDTKLFLDTHPCHKEAMEYFDTLNQERVRLLTEYARCYGPITLDTADSCVEQWNWIQEPWPWQEGGC